MAKLIKNENMDSIAGGAKVRMHNPNLYGRVFDDSLFRVRFESEGERAAAKEFFEDKWETFNAEEPMDYPKDKWVNEYVKCTDLYADELPAFKAFMSKKGFSVR